MTESIQERLERSGAENKFLIQYNMHLSRVAGRVVSDAALEQLGKAMEAMGDAWAEALPKAPP
jgi:hypothetical protein